MKIKYLRRTYFPYLLATLVVLCMFAIAAPKVFAATNGKITYCSDLGAGTDVFVMDSDGSNKTQLTNDGQSCYPSIAPDGSKVMYWTVGDPLRISMINPDGTSNQIGIVTGAYSKFLPDGTKFFFADLSSGFEAKIANIDGSSQQSVSWTPALEGGANVINFSPDGSKIAYANPDGLGTSSYIAGVDGLSPFKVNSVEWAIMPNFSSDGETIYFAGYGGGETYSLFSVGVDGSNETELQTLPTTGYPARLVISPDGTKLLFGTINPEDNTKDVYTMNVDGSNQVKIIDDYDLEGGVIPVNWSPDSTKLVFPKIGAGNVMDIFVINADGTGLTNLTNTPDEQEIIAYSDQSWAAAPVTEDSDGIQNDVENAAPNSGDANNDGTPDSEQSDVASFVDPASGQYAVLQVSNECSITSVSTAAESSNTTQDTNFSYPTGLMDFTLDCGTPSTTATVTQYYYGASGNFTVRKYNPNNQTYQTIDSASISSQTIGGQSARVATYQVKDGGPLDLDGTEDGNIHDPAGLATSTEALADTGQNTNPLILLSALLLTSGLATATYTYNKQGEHTHAISKK